MSIAMPAAEPSFTNLPAARLRQEGLSSSDRNFAIWMHIAPLLAFFVVGPFAAVAPMILWFARRDQSSFADDHGRETLNMSITGVIFFVIGILTGIGFLFWLVWAVVAMINVVRGAIAANNGEYFRYPMTIRML